MLGRMAIAVTSLLAVYFMLPLQSRDNIGVRAVAVIVGLTIFGAIFARQLRQIRKARYPVLRAVEAMRLVATLFIVVMASIHYSLGAATPSSYSETLSRLDALYFTVTTLATVGYGDITPTSSVTAFGDHGSDGARCCPLGRRYPSPPGHGPDGGRRATARQRARQRTTPVAGSRGLRACLGSASNWIQSPLMSGGRVTAGALDGVVIADFSRVLAGPYATMLLADLGAEVIKVERPGTGDDTRAWGPPWRGDQSTYFAVGQPQQGVGHGRPRNRRGPWRRLGSWRLGPTCVVENFKPGAFDRMGLGYEELQLVKPRPGVLLDHRLRNDWWCRPSRL